jgi:hypothetical protein
MTEPQDPGPQPTRREFAALALLGASAATRVAQAQPEKAPATVADALVEVVRLRHGERLTAEQLRAVKASIARTQASAERLRRVKLVNADEPDFIARADVP